MNIEQYRGSILGLATGDALGTTLEFTPPESVSPLTDMVGGGPFHLEPGEWTDDTSMALCLAESLLKSNGFNARDQIERYVMWMQDGYMSSNGRCFDIGNTVRAALERFLATGNPCDGSKDSLSAGNGSIMRLAPVPLYFAEKPEGAIALSGESSRTTHGAIACIDACRYFGGLIVGAVQGATKEELLSSRYAPIPDYWNGEPLCSEIDDIAKGSFKSKMPPEIRGTGYVVQSLEAALWAFHRTENFRDGALMAVNLGDDADTTGAVYGQLAGAYYGVGEIPEEWVSRLALREVLERTAYDLFHFRARSLL